jgi:mRNA interferase MazF
MSELRRGWVIDVDLDPTKGSETGKVRPCVVVTNDVYNQRVPVIQVVPLTEWTDKKGRIRTNVRVEPSVINGLRKVFNCRLFADSSDRSASAIGSS